MSTGRDTDEYVLVSPNDTLITATYDVIEARGEIGGWTKKDDGTFELDWAGETDVLWDTQETKERDGKPIYLDDEGGEWTEDECRFMTIDEFDALDEEEDDAS